VRKITTKLKFSLFVCVIEAARFLLYVRSLFVDNSRESEGNDLSD
jgi:hypothetical protein